MNEELEFIHDAGHGWLRVPLEHLVELGIADEITQYSYMNNWYAFLEEDCDAGIYLGAIKKANLPTPDIKERHVAIHSRTD